MPVVDTGEVNEILSERSNRRLLALARLAVNREDSLAWWTLLHLEPGIGPAVRNHFYDRAVEADHRFVDQLLAEHAVGYPELPAAQRQRVRRAVASTNARPWGQWTPTPTPAMRRRPCGW